MRMSVRPMARFANFFVILCMTIVAASLGVVFRLQADFTLANSMLVSLAFLAVFLVLHLHSLRRRDYDEMMDRADEVERQNDLVLEDVRNLEKRLSSLEANAHVRGSNQDIEPVIAEVEVLGTLIKQVAETMADFEKRLVQKEWQNEPTLRATAAAAPVQQQPNAPVAPVQVQDHDPGNSDHDVFEVEETAPPLDPILVEKVRKSIEASKVDLYLQPIVTLPQRKTRYYEALTRLPLEGGEVMLPTDYLPLAEAAGIMPVLDNLLLLRSVQIVRRLTTRNKDAGIFCNISPTSLADADFFQEFIEFMESNRALSSHLVFEFSQKTVRAMGPVEFESLQALVDLGYRLSIDQITDMRMDLGNLASRGFKFAKIAGDRLLAKSVELGTEIHVEDLSSLMLRNGIELIVDRIETESQVLDLLDYNVAYAQGFLFSPPRPVRADVFQGYASGPEQKRLATG